MILLTIKLFVSMKVEKEMKYEAHEVDILEVVVEKGFAASGDFNDGNTEDA